MVKEGTQGVRVSTTKTSSSAGNLANMIWMAFDGWYHSLLI